MPAIEFTVEEVQALRTGEKNRSAWLVEPQPSLRGPFEFRQQRDGLWYAYDDLDNTFEWYGEPLKDPLQGFTELWVKEPFCLTRDGPLYEADSNEWEGVRFSPAALMDRKHSRYTLVIQRVYPLSLADLDEDDLRHFGFGPEMVDSGAQDPGSGAWIEIPDYSVPFARWWNRKYPDYPYLSWPWVWVIEHRLKAP
jgi:hypothetical protein